MKKILLPLLFLFTFPVFILPISQGLPRYRYTRYRHTEIRPEDIIRMTARYISPTQLEITLKNSSSTSVHLFTAGRQIRTIAPASIVMHRGRTTRLFFPSEVTIPAGKSTTFRLTIPRDSALPGDTIIYKTISLLTAGNSLNEGDFNLRATIAQ